MWVGGASADGMKTTQHAASGKKASEQSHGNASENQEGKCIW